MRKEQVLLLIGLIWFVGMVYVCYHHTLKHGGPRIRICNADEISEVERNVLMQYEHTHGDDWDVFLVCSLQNVEQELLNYGYFAGRSRHGWVMGIDRIDSFAAKDRLWVTMSAKYSNKATEWVPQTWLLKDHESVNLNGTPDLVVNGTPNSFNSYFNTVNPDAMYIMKRNTQRQTGLRVVRAPNRLELSQAVQDGYVIIQKILPDPFLIDGFKINVRAYVMVTCSHGVRAAWVHHLGFMYYAPKRHEKGTTSDEIITTGYVSREMYDLYPLTTDDFYEYLGRERTERYLSQRNATLRTVFEAFRNKFCMTKGNVSFCQLLGIDLQPNADLSSVKMIEMNKGPSLEIMDDRDGRLKYIVIQDVYRTILQPTSRTGFELFWSSR